MNYIGEDCSSSLCKNDCNSKIYYFLLNLF
jgi:hypothetical protein